MLRFILLCPIFLGLAGSSTFCLTRHDPACLFSLEVFLFRKCQLVFISYLFPGFSPFSICFQIMPPKRPKSDASVPAPSTKRARRVKSKEGSAPVVKLVRRVTSSTTVQQPPSLLRAQQRSYPRLFSNS